MFQRWLLVVVLSNLCLTADGLALELRADRPQSYRVADDDTVWEIASRYLVHPWQWSELWRRNPENAAPEAIYPGDLLELDDAPGGPMLTVVPAEDVRLRPSVRIETPGRGIPTIPLDAIRPFLSNPRPLSVDERNSAPYIVGLPERRIAGGGGDLIYAHALKSQGVRNFTVYRAGQMLRDVDTDEVLGYEGVYVADAELVEPGDPATLALSRNQREAVIGDQLLPRETVETGLFIQPHPLRHPLQGHIIAVLDGVSQIGQYQVVTLDRGRREGIETGHVFKVLQKGFELRDSRMAFGTDLTAPKQEAGLLIVFRVFDRLSYALILEASRAIHVFDYIQTP